MAKSSFVVGERFTVADIVLYGVLDFAAVVGQPLDPALAHLAAWNERVASRESTVASLEFE